MEKINLKNMPNSELYEFSPGRYVWKIIRRGGTREANYLNENKVSEYTEVFKIRKDGDLSCEWSGEFSANPALTDENGLDSQGCFYIFSLDLDCGALFKQTQDLVKAPAELQAKALEKEKNVVAYIQDKLNEQSKRRY